MNNPKPPPDPVPPLLPGVADVHTVRPWRWWVHLLLLSAYPLAIGLSGAVVGGSGPATPALTGSASGLLIVSGIQLGLFGLVFGLAWLASRASSDDLLLRWRGGVGPVALGLGYSVAIRLGMAVILAFAAAFLMLTGTVTPQTLQEFLLANRPEVEEVVDVSALGENPVYFWLSLTLVSFVVAGLREELWRAGVLAGFAALWPRRFGTGAGRYVAVVLAALIFGFGHLPQGWLAVALTGAIGLGLGVIMVFHRSIWPAVIAHGMFNATSMALIPWAIERMKAG